MQRTIIIGAVAGLSIMVGCMSFMACFMVSYLRGIEDPPLVPNADVGSPAWAQGVRPGDTIDKPGDEPRFEQLLLEVAVDNDGNIPGARLSFGKPTAVAAADASKWTAKPATVELPKELAEPVKALLSDKAVQVTDGDGKAICDLWFRKQVPVKATAQEIQKGVNYRQVEQSTVMGAVRFAQEWTDFRKQKIKAGVYTLRIGYQPMDGDHMGTAPYTEFLLLCPAAEDKKPGLLEPKALHELSDKSITGGSHPTVVLLFPNPKPEDTPKVVSKGNGIWVLNLKQDAMAGDQKTILGLGLTLFGVTTAE